MRAKTLIFIQVSVTAVVEGVTVTATFESSIIVENELESITIRDIQDANILFLFDLANTISELADVGTRVSGIYLQVRDEGDRVLSNGLTWSLSDSSNGLFAINSNSGIISLAQNGVLDYESQANIEIEVSVTAVRGSTAVTGTLVVTIEVENELDLAIEDVDPSENTIPESAIPGTVVSGISLQARDESTGALLDDAVWSLEDSANGVFSISSNSGEISLSSTATLDYESVQEYEVIVQAQIMAGSSATTIKGLVVLEIKVENVPDTFNLVDSNPSANEISENALAGTAISGMSLQVLNEMDVPTDGVFWSLSESANNTFAINATSGEVSLAPSASLDYEAVTSYTLEVTAELLVLGSSETLTLSLAIAVLNESDAFNLVDSDSSANEISESAPAGTAISGVLLQVLNEMNAPVSDVVWSLTESANNLFTIDTRNGEVSLAPSMSLDYEQATSYTLVVVALVSFGDTTENLTISLEVTVLNESDTFNLVDSDASANEISESAVAGTAISGVLLQVLNEMSAPAENVSWSLTESASDTFAIDATNGEISLSPSASLDYESVTSYTLEVTAELLVLGSSETLTLSLGITVLNESDTFNLVDSDTSANEISESAPAGTAISGVLLQVLNEMDAPTDGVVWDLSESANNTFAISATSGEVSLAPSASLDYESATSYTLVVVASVSFGDTTNNLTISLDIAVLNESDTFNLVDSDASVNEISESASAGTAVSGMSLQVLDEMDALVNDVSWSLTESANGTFTINETSGEVSLSSDMSLDYESTTSYTLVVVASVSFGDTTNNLTISLAVVVLNESDTFNLVDSDISANEISEEALAGAVINGVSLQVLNEMNTPEENIIWSLTESANGTFVINTTSGEISLSSDLSLDYESTASYTLVVIASVSYGDTSENLTISLDIAVLNESEIYNLVDSDPLANEISERAMAGTAVSGILLQVIDAMGVPSNDVSWSLSESTAPFTIGTTSGAITLSSGMSLDYETIQEYSLIATADVLFNGTTENSTLNLRIVVLNESDTFSLVDSDLSANQISERAPAGTTVSGVSLQVLNEMDALEDSVFWSLVSAVDAPFVISATSGVITLSPDMSLDYEVVTSYTLEAIAELLVFGTSETLTISLVVAVLNESDTFNLVDSDPSANEISERAVAGTAISGMHLQVLNEMDASTDGVFWSLTESANGTFEIDATNGEISLAPDESLDYETVTSYTLEAIAELLVFGSTETLTISLAITVLNVSDTFNLVDSNVSANEISESALAGTAISGVLLQVLNEMNAPAENVVWSLTESANGTFAISVTSGEVSLAPDESLDYETITSYTLEAIAELLVFGSSQTLTISLAIAILNEQDTFNLVDSDESANEISESAVAGTAISGMHLQVLNEMDAPVDSVFWSLTESANGTFAISATNGEVSLALDKSLDYEDITSYTVDVIAEFLVLGSTKTLTISLDITVLNESDTFNLVDSDLSANSISESAVAGTAISGVSLQVLNEMSAPEDSVVWDLSESANNTFTIDAMSGEISLAEDMSLDYESTTSYTLVVVATVSFGDTTNNLTISLDIAVLNESDTFDLVDSDTSANSISESAVAGTAISGVSLQVIDRMDVPVSNVLWSLSESANGTFAISATNGEVSLAVDKSLDYEQVTSYTLVVVASVSFGDTTENLTISLEVAVLNESDTFNLVDSDESANEILENASAGTAVSGVSLQVLNEMNAPTENIVWSLTESADNPFAIDETNGEVSLAPSASLDYESATSHTVEVTAELLVLGSSETLTMSLAIAVLNEQDTFNLVDSDPSANEISESAPAGTAINGVSLQVLNEMNMLTDGVVWSLTESANSTFAINETNGEVSLAPSASLDYESVTSYTLVVVASVSFGDTAKNLTINLTIAVLNESDTFNLVDGDAEANEISENAVAGTAISGVSLQVLNEMDAPVDSVFWSLTESANGTFAISSTNGEISLSSDMSLDYETTTSYTLEVIAELLVLGSTQTLTISLDITVLNALESIAIEDVDSSENTISESAIPGTTVSGISLQAQDENSRALADGVVWSLEDSADGVFSIDSRNGEISLSPTASLDFDTRSSYEVQVQASVSLPGMSPQVATRRIEIRVIRSIVLVNGFSIVDLDPAPNTIPESALTSVGGDRVLVSGLTLEVIDESGSGTNIRTSLVLSASGRFHMATTGSGPMNELRFIGLEQGATLNYETAQSYTVIARVTHVTDPARVRTFPITIAVENVLESITLDDTDRSRNEISEYALKGTEVSGISLQVRDEGSRVLSDGLIWSLSDSANGVFAISSASGVVTLAQNGVLDFGIQQRLSLQVSVTAVMGSARVATDYSLTISVINEGNDSYMIEDINDSLDTISELAQVGDAVSGISLQVRNRSTSRVLTDDEVVWSLEESANGLFAISSANGVITLAQDGMLDYESGQRSITIIVRATAVMSDVTMCQDCIE